jgi:D-alanyl-D-alanine carboxypeptidase
MNAKRLIPGSAIIVIAALNVVTGHADEMYGAAPKNVTEYLDRLVSAYPDKIAGHDNAFLILKNGMKFRISDGRTNKSFQELLEKPDIDDMFSMRYPAGSAPAQPAKNSDPGRVRFEPLFVAMYGDCNKHDVARTLRSIKWLPKHGGGSVAVTRTNRVAAALERVSRDLDELPGDQIKYLVPLAGAYHCRNVAGSSVKSMHGYGAAIDINLRYANYWRWAHGNRDRPRWRNHIPIEIVRVFERHGFIWGGYWYHYDTMHFEYRPELLGGKM